MLAKFFDCKLLLIVLLCNISIHAHAQFNVIVSKDGTGSYSSVQAAIDAAPSNRTTPYVIYIKNGRYKEKINIPSTKPFIQIVGEDVAKVVITYDDYASKMTSCFATLGTQNSASFTVNATDFAAYNVTFENSYGEGSQAVAVLVNADRAVFYNCRFLGNQDTVYLKGGGTPRNYFKSCYIDGNIDFIFGSSVAILDSCVIYAKSRTSSGSSYITAPNTPAGQSYGFIFRDCKFPNNTGNTSYYLSRPWPSPSPSGTQQKVILLSCLLSSHINPAGWTIWDANTITSNLYYAEYNSRYFNGLPVDVSQRVSWSYQITQSDSSNYSITNVFSTWDPLNVINQLAHQYNTSLSVSNLTASKNGISTKISWNTTFPTADVQYQLFKSTDSINFTLLNTWQGINDSIINYSYIDNNVPPSGTKYFYYLTASKTGVNTYISDTMIVSSCANFVINASPSLYLCGFSQTVGVPSAAQTYTILGSNLLSDILITPPANFEISSDNINWYTSLQTLHLTPTSGTIPTSNIYIRLNATAVGSYSGSILNVSTGDTDVTVRVAGITYPVSTSFPLQVWPMTVNNNDSALARSVAVMPSTSLVNTTNNNLYTSDGTQPSANPISAYSPQFGQALGANSTGYSWTNVGSTLNRRYYEQFTVTAASGYSIKIDSISFLSDFYLTNSGTKMAIVYSKNGFTSPADSSEINSVIGPNGTLLTLTSSGTFSKAFPLLRNDAGPVNYYSVSLNGNTGISLNPGESITIRLYWACGSTGSPRFAFLKNLSIIGVVTSPLPVKLLSFEGYKVSNGNLLKWKTENEMNINRYVIERSEDGKYFTPLTTLYAANKNGINEYQYNDAEILSNKNYYYRLQINESNGTVTSSKIISLFGKNLYLLSVSPNPTAGIIKVQHEPTALHASLSIKNFKGETLMKYNLLPGISSSCMDVSSLTSSTYILVFENNQTIHSLTFLKK